MARHEQSREDLLAEATALVRRAELTLAGCAEPIVLGLRDTGCLSLYIGEDPAYHFNSQGELRRVYLAGKLLKAERGQLVSLTRQRTATAVQLLAEPLSAAAKTACLGDCAVWLERLQTALVANDVALLRQVPVELTSHELATWLANIPRPLSIAQFPHAR